MDDKILIEWKKFNVYKKLFTGLNMPIGKLEVSE